MKQGFKGPENTLGPRKRQNPSPQEAQGEMCLVVQVVQTAWGRKLSIQEARHEQQHAAGPLQTRGEAIQA